MHVSNTISLFLSSLLLTSSSLAQPTANTSGYTSRNTWGSNANTQPCAYQGISAQWRDQIVNNYLTLWSTGDSSLLNEVASPNITVYQDRIPTGNGSIVYPISNSSTFFDFIQVARDGFSTYEFVNMLNFGEDNLVAARWQLQAVATGENGTQTQALTNGTQVVYNGTDILTLDRCTGLVAEVLLAQDFITYFHELQTPLGTV